MSANFGHQSTDLFFGDIPLNANDDFIKKLIQEVDPTAAEHAQVILKTNRSNTFQYAFVKLPDPSSAELVLKELNYTRLDGTPLRISYADPETRKILHSGRGNLFVKNIDKEIEVSQIHEAFQVFGEIISCKIPLTDGVSRGYGYVQFRDPEAAERAKVDLSEAYLNGAKIVIEDYVRKPRKDINETFTNVYIKDLPASINSTDKLKELVAPFGEIQHGAIQTDKDGNPLPFGFVNFMTHEAAVNCVNELNGKEIDGSVLTANRAQTKTERQALLTKTTAAHRKEIYEKTKGRNLYVRGFDENFTDEDLKAAFQEYGTIESAAIMYDSNGVSKKFGFVCFSTIQEADAAIAGQIGKLFVTKAIRNDERIKNNFGVPQQNSTARNETFTNKATPLEKLLKEINELPNAAELKIKAKGISTDQAQEIITNQEAWNKFIAGDATTTAQ